MKRRFIVLFLVGGLVAGLCGCGGSSGDSLPSETVVDDNHISMETVEEVLPEESNEPEPEEVEVSEETDEGEYTTEEDFADQAEESWEDEGFMVDVDVAELLTTRAVEFEDMDGYTIRETCQVSPIFTEDDMETMRALWMALGNDIAIFPSSESMFDASHRDSCDRLEYVIGTYMVENLTNGFSIVPDNPRSYTGLLVPLEDGKTPAQYKEAAANHFKYDNVTMVSYANKVVYYDSSIKNAGLISDVKMESDIWGPRAFIMAVPNCSIPNQPDGYRYDKLTLMLCGNHHMNREEFVTFELSYYSKEVE